MFRHFMIQINELKITPLYNPRVAENQNLHGTTELHRPWWYWRVMSLKSTSIRTVIFLQGRRRGRGGGRWGERQGLVNYYKSRLLTGRWDEFYAVEDTGSSWFLKPFGFRPPPPPKKKNQQLKFAFCSINSIRSNTGTTEQVCVSGEVGGGGRK